MQNVTLDAAMAKPGITRLMRAAIIAGSVEIQRLISASDLNAQDSSGWTALVYAAQGAVTLRGLTTSASMGNQVHPLAVLPRQDSVP